MENSSNFMNFHIHCCTHQTKISMAIILTAIARFIWIEHHIKIHKENDDCFDGYFWFEIDQVLHKKRFPCSTRKERERPKCVMKCFLPFRSVRSTRPHRSLFFIVSPSSILLIAIASVSGRSSSFLAPWARVHVKCASSSSSSEVNLLILGRYSRCLYIVTHN